MIRLTDERTDKIIKIISSCNESIQLKNFYNVLKNNRFTPSSNIVEHQHFAYNYGKITGALHIKFDKFQPND